MLQQDESARYVLAFDTANEVIAIGLGLLDASTQRIECVASFQQEARRASNTRLLPCIDELLRQEEVARGAIACVVCGRGPGSFTGVRIAMSTAKGIAQALPAAEARDAEGPDECCGVALVGVGSLDAVAWNAWVAGVRGSLAVVADAMRHEVYPVRFELTDAGVERLQADTVMKAEVAAAALGPKDDGAAAHDATGSGHLLITGDALAKYADLFEPCGTLLPNELWAPTGRGLLLAAEAMWRSGVADPFDAQRHNPAFALPVYTRLSDAEENERKRLARAEEKDLQSGVQGEGEADGRAARTRGPQSALHAGGRGGGVSFKPLDRAHVPEAVAIERELMGSNAWSETLMALDLAQKNRTWWMCVGDVHDFDLDDRAHAASRKGDLEQILGYAGGMIVDGDVEILKVAVVPQARRRGLAKALLAHVAEDARNLGANTVSLEVRAGNVAAQALYSSLGMESLGTRPRYYQDGEDALIMKGSLDALLAQATAGAHTHDVAVAGMKVANSVHGHVPAGSASPASAGSEEASHEEASHAVVRPLIFAIESSCDETAAAIIDGTGELLADVVASQIDFHARFGGVVPEIASRKHIEAICGVCDECFELAAERLGCATLGWRDLDGVSVTYAPGLVGALVVGVAFAKGAAWAADLPFIGVNHLEGHLYANKLSAGFQPPAVVSLVSGGNTMLVHMKDWGSYETLGATIDDAVGEAFDKVAKALGLGYPGGPVISRLAAQGDPAAIAFPRAMMHSGDLRFSLSGLKTAVVTYINQEREAGRALNLPDIAASFQQAVIDVQVAKARTALEQTGARTFCLGGGVAANPALRHAYEQLCAQKGIVLVMPPLSSCGDNAGMIALVALDRYRAGRFFSLDADAFAHADLDEPY